MKPKPKANQPERKSPDLPRIEANREICAPEICAPEICTPASYWKTRGYLPHFDDGHRQQHVTLHLADSLPGEAIAKMEQLTESLPDEERKVERRRLLHDYLDAGVGCCVLKHDGPANDVQNAILHFNGKRYELCAWVVMPNHLHVLFRPTNGWTVAKIVASWKKFTARNIKDWIRPRIANGITNEARLLEDHVWHPEYWDRYIRNERHFRRTVDYIHHNPVKAGLCKSPQDWPWSSATERKSPDLLQPTERKSPDLPQPPERKSPDLLQPPERKSPDLLQPWERKSPDLLQPTERKSPDLPH